MSLKAIATALGVSVTTVSRALGGYADVSASTRARVEAEARRRGYRPKEGANKRGNSSRLTQSFHFFMFEPIF
ncbi:LacI family DNA-binding transcriptional regulator, partial [Escherichia coli]|nr:LacI family DNA-binding transcriptional regulator [Escherichia coli]